MIHNEDPQGKLLIKVVRNDLSTFRAVCYDVRNRQQIGVVVVNKFEPEPNRQAVTSMYQVYFPTEHNGRCIKCETPRSAMRVLHRQLTPWGRFNNRVISKVNRILYKRYV